MAANKKVRRIKGRKRLRVTRKNVNRNAPAMVFPVPLALLLAILAVLGFSYLWVDGLCASLGTEIRRLEHRKTQLGKSVITEEYKWSSMTSAKKLQRAVYYHRLNMSWPDETQVVVIRDIDRWLEQEELPRGKPLTLVGPAGAE